MKDKIINIFIALLFIISSTWAFYETIQEMQEVINCNSVSLECIYIKGCPFINPSYSKTFYLQDTLLEQHQRLARSSKRRTHTEVDSFIITQGEYIKVSNKIFEKLFEYKQNPAGYLFYQNYKIGLTPLCILFFIVGVVCLINEVKNKK